MPDPLDLFATPSCPASWHDDHAEAASCPLCGASTCYHCLRELPADDNGNHPTDCDGDWRCPTRPGPHLPLTDVHPTPV